MEEITSASVLTMFSDELYIKSSTSISRIYVRNRMDNCSSRTTPRDIITNICLAGKCTMFSDELNIKS